MRFVENLRDIQLKSNVQLLMRERGKMVRGSHREGHNVYTVTGRNLLSKLMAWQTIGGTDIPYTHRRTRWAGVGLGSQLEVTTVSGLVTPALFSATDYLATIGSVEFPTSTSVRYIREFGTSEITIAGLPVTITEAGLFADVSPADTAGGTEDVAVNAGTVDTTLDPSVGTNPPIAYKSFEGLTKTVDFTVELRWEFRF